MNLLAETIIAIRESGHFPNDIVFIGSLESGHSCTWEEFQTLADFVYNEGFGSPQVATDLKIVFSDGSTMWRGEYDGSEWWSFSEPASIPTETHPIRSLRGGFWTTLADIEDDD